jgi:hypothetical protein
LIAIALLKPKLLFDYFVALGAGEHFFIFRHEVKAQLQEELAAIKVEKQRDELTKIVREASRPKPISVP